MPRQPIDAFGRPATLRKPLGVELVDGWKQQSLALVRRQQRELSGNHTVEFRMAPGLLLAALLATVGVASWSLRGSERLLPVLALAGVAAAVSARRIMLRSRQQRANLPALIERAEQCLQRDDPAGAFRRAQAALRVAELAPQRNRLRWVLAWAAIGKNDPLLAHFALQELPRNQLTIELVAAYLTCCNRRDEAMALLWEARAMGQRARETTKLLVDLLVRDGTKSRALEVLLEDRQLLTSDDLSALEAAGLLPHVEGTGG